MYSKHLPSISHRGRHHCFNKAPLPVELRNTALQVGAATWMDLTRGTESLCCSWFCFSLLTYMRYWILLLRYSFSPSVENQSRSFSFGREIGWLFSHSLCCLSETSLQKDHLVVIHSFLKASCVFIPRPVRESNTCCFIAWANHLLN